jgi:hypothetical protein
MGGETNFTAVIFSVQMYVDECAALLTARATREGRLNQEGTQQQMSPTPRRRVGLRRERRDRHARRGVRRFAVERVRGVGARLCLLCAPNVAERHGRGTAHAVRAEQIGFRRGLRARCAKRIGRMITSVRTRNGVCGLLMSCGVRNVCVTAGVIRCRRVGSRRIGRMHARGDGQHVPPPAQREQADQPVNCHQTPHKSRPFDAPS